VKEQKYNRRGDRLFSPHNSNPDPGILRTGVKTMTKINSHREILKRRFGRTVDVPLGLVRSYPQLSALAFRIYTVLCWLSDNDAEVAFPSYQFLHAVTGSYKEALSRAIKELETNGLLRIDRSSGKVNHYLLLKPKDAPNRFGNRTGTSSEIELEPVRKSNSSIPDIALPKDSFPKNRRTGVEFAARTATSLFSRLLGEASPPMEHLESFVKANDIDIDQAQLFAAWYINVDRPQRVKKVNRQFLDTLWFDFEFTWDSHNPEISGIALSTEDLLNATLDKLKTGEQLGSKQAKLAAVISSNGKV
jgi:Helix-turn-helix domain